jgi:hypothetical protein
VEVVTRLWESDRRKRPILWPKKWILHRYTAPAHDALKLREFSAKKSITKMDHPSYSPDLAPCNIWPFPKLKKNKNTMKVFADIPDTQRNVTMLLRGTP